MGTCLTIFPLFASCLFFSLQARTIFLIHGFNEKRRQKLHPKKNKKRRKNLKKQKLKSSKKKTKAQTHYALLRACIVLLIAYNVSVHAELANLSQRSYS